MENVKIDKLHDVIIVEKYKGDKILKDSLLFCGCCGQSLAQLKSSIEFPFKFNELEKRLKNKSYKMSTFGMRHDKCRHTMFSFKKNIGFISLENHEKQLRKELINEN